MNTFRTFLFCLTGLLFFSCNESDLTLSCINRFDTDKGSIIESLDIACAPTGTSQQVIKSDSAYQKLLTTCNESGPDIDFTQFSLLVYTTAASGCTRFYEREVSQEEATKRYVFTVRITECGGCEPWVTQTHWVKVPRLPDGYTVSFEEIR